MNKRGKRMRKIVVLFVLISVSLFLLADETTILKNLEKKYSSIKTFEADIMMTTTLKRDADFPIPNVSGSVYVDNQVFVVEYTSPTHQLMKYENGKFAIYTNGIVVEQDDYDQGPHFFDTGNLNKLSEIMRKDSETVDYIIYDVVLADVSFNELKVYVNKKDELIEKVMLDMDETNQIYTFTNQKINKPLSKPIESFKIPEGAERFDPKMFDFNMMDFD
jgi:outer membrane lipoprotein-sorting protein